MIVGRKHSEQRGRLVGRGPAGPITHAGRAPCVVALHGFSGSTAEIRPLTSRLSANGYAVEAPLLRGHGSNPCHLQMATFEAWVSDVREEIGKAQERYGSFVLCGFSLGSLVAIELAAERPAGLVGLVLLGTALTLSAPLRTVLGFVDRRAWDLPDWYLLKLWSPDVRDREQKERIVSYDRDPLRAALEVYRAGRRVEHRLPFVTCPTLAIHGGKDRVCPTSNADRIAKHLGTRDVRTKIYPKSAHLVAADVDRDAVAEDVVAFVDRVAMANRSSLANTAQRMPVEP